MDGCIEAKKSVYFESRMFGTGFSNEVCMLLEDDRCRKVGRETGREELAGFSWWE